MGVYNNLVTSLAPTFRWMFDGDIRDSGGLSQNGTGYGTYKFAEGIIPTESSYECLDLSTDADQIQLDDHALINSGSGYVGAIRCIGFWVSPRSLPVSGSGDAIWKQGGSTNWIEFYFYLDGKLYLSVGESGVPSNHCSFPVVAGETYFVVGIVDMTSSPNISLYVNGDLVDSTDSPANDDGELDAHSGDCSWGKQDSHAKNHLGVSMLDFLVMDGFLQDGIYWSGTKLTAEQIKAIYSAGALFHSSRSRQTNSGASSRTRAGITNA